MNLLFKMEENDTIGILNGYEYDELCSVGSLRNHIKHGGTVYTATQYCDRRFNTDLRRFNFDPYTGKKIDWKEVHKMIEQFNIIGDDPKQTTLEL